MTVAIFSEKEHPIAKNAFDYLVSKNLIFPGSMVTKEEVESALGIEYEEKDWRFLGPYLLLKNKLESMGYFITQKEMEEPGFRILDTEEMADHAQRKLMKNMASNFKVSLIMATHDCSKLSEDKKKKYKKIQSQAGQSALMQQKMLFNDLFF